MAALENLPSEILERIFHLLDFRDRIRLEGVCRIWRHLCLSNGWTGVRQLTFTREMLGVDEPWKPFLAKEMERFRNTNVSVEELQQILQNPAIYRKKRPSRSLGVLNAYLRRCGPHLVEFHLGRGICCNTRFGRLLPLLSSKLAHLRIEEPLDEWHCRQIECHLAPQLLSLSAHPYEKVFKKRPQKTKIAFASLLAKCERLECLRVDYLDNCFWPDKDGQLRVVVPATLKYLHNYKSICLYGVHEKWDELVQRVWALLEACPQLQFFLPFLMSNVWEHEEDDLTLDNQLLNLQWPLLFIQSQTLPDLELHSRIGALRALKLHDEHVTGDDFEQIANDCPQLEHIDFKKRFVVDHLHGYAPLRELMEPLYALCHLSSLGIQIEMRERFVINEQLNFHDMECIGGEQMDDAMLEILAHLDTINPLKSIEFHYEHYQNLQLSREYICRLAQQLPHLEHFYCCLDVYGYGCQDWPEDRISELNTILSEGHEHRKSANFYFHRSLSCGKEICLNWQKNGDKAANLQQQNQKPLNVNDYWDSRFHFKTGHSPVLRRILDEELGPSRAHILFGFS